MSDKKSEIALNRQAILDKGIAMQRLLKNPDFIVFVEDLDKDRHALLANLLNENSVSMTDNTTRTRIIARINQIDKLTFKPKQAIRTMMALKEIREGRQKQKVTI